MRVTPSHDVGAEHLDRCADLDLAVVGRHHQRRPGRQHGEQVAHQPVDGAQLVVEVVAQALARGRPCRCPRSRRRRTGRPPQQAAHTVTSPAGVYHRCSSTLPRCAAVNPSARSRPASPPGRARRAREGGQRLELVAARGSGRRRRRGATAARSGRRRRARPGSRRTRAGRDQPGDQRGQGARRGGRGHRGDGAARPGRRAPGRGSGGPDSCSAPRPSSDQQHDLAGPRQRIRHPGGQVVGSCPAVARPGPSAEWAPPVESTALEVGQDGLGATVGRPDRAGCPDWAGRSSATPAGTGGSPTVAMVGRNRSQRAP